MSPSHLQASELPDDEQDGPEWGVGASGGPRTPKPAQRGHGGYGDHRDFSNDHGLGPIGPDSAYDQPPQMAHPSPGQFPQSPIPALLRSPAAAAAATAGVATGPRAAVYRSERSCAKLS